MKSTYFAAIAFLAGVSTVYGQSPNNSGFNTRSSATSTQWNNQNPVTNQNSATNKTALDNQSSNSYTQPSNVPMDIQNFNSPKDKKQLGWTDEDISLNIRSAIREDRSLSDAAKSTEVSVKSGNVTLNGAVSSDDEKAKLATIARQTQGVKSVSNNIAVRR